MTTYLIRVGNKQVPAPSQCTDKHRASLNLWFQTVADRDAFNDALQAEIAKSKLAKLHRYPQETWTSIPGETL